MFRQLVPERANCTSCSRPIPAAQPKEFSMTSHDTLIRYGRQNVDGFSIFYREAGVPTAPAVLLLHGLPSSSHMFRNLIPLLAPHFRVVAPDLPGFGFSDAPSRLHFAYTFDHLADVI